jgi:prepilin-type N-terminal cleavage/methylation domain-containing protein
LIASIKKAKASQKDDGFTLIETLIALIILAISSGILLQWISLGTIQLQSANRQQAAKQLALILLAENQTVAESLPQREGRDDVSGLYWNYKTELRDRKFGERNSASITFIRLEISTTKGAVPIYRSATILMRAPKQ